jgi:glucose/arabinose dehydrogenase
MMRWLLCLLAFALLLGGCNSGKSSPPSTNETRSPTQARQGTCLPEETRAPVLAACQALAQKLDADPGDIQLVSAQEQQWPDSCLGVPQQNEACAQVITSGFDVVLKLRTAETTYTFHTDAGKNVRLAGLELRPRQVDVQLGEAELVVRGAEPVAFDFAPDGRLFYTERQTGEIKTVDAGASDAQDQVFATLSVYRGPECGLLGIVIDPQFTSNHYVYVYVTQPVAGRTDVGTPKLIRFEDADGKGVNPKVIIDDLPLTNDQECAHVSGNLHFGPDGYLYVSIGNFERPQTAANLSIPTGKILRIKADGSAAPDNPFVKRPNADPRIFAYGFRNPWDFAFHPLTGKLYAPDNGPGNCDELNLVEAGQDYGVPRSLPAVDVSSCLGLGGVDPIFLFAKPDQTPEHFGSNVAPAGVAFLQGDRYPQLGVGLLACEYVTKSLRYLEFSGPEQKVLARNLVIGNDCQFNVEVDRQGTIYYSNGEGIWRLPPQ